MNKILLLSLIAVLTSSNAFAASSGNCGTGCTYTLDNNGLLTVTGTGENASISASTFYGNSLIKDIVIQGTIKSIGTDAFHSLSNLNTIDMSQSQIKTIGTGAFMDSGLSTLKSIEFSPTLETLGYAAFKNTGRDSTAFTKVEFPDSLKTIENQGFCYKYYLQELKLSSELESVNEWLGLAGLTRLEYLVIPDTLTPDKIGDDAFRNLSYNANNHIIYCSLENKATCEKIIAESHLSRDQLSYKIYTKDGDHYIVDGKKYGTLSDLGYGREYHDAKRIYTVEEATEAVKDNKNTFSIKYR